MGIKLVVADDAPFIRDVLRNIFLETEIQLIGEAADGEQAVEMAGRLLPDVILMDIVMPKKSGIEAAAEIAEKFPAIRIIAFSTMDQESMVAKALEAGCCDYIVKPFQAENILSAVRAAKKKV